MIEPNRNPSTWSAKRRMLLAILIYQRYIMTPKDGEGFWLEYFSELGLTDELNQLLSVHKAELDFPLQNTPLAELDNFPPFNLN